MSIVIESLDILSVAEAARLLSKPRLTIYRWVKSGGIIGLKFGGTLYIPRSEVERIKARTDVRGY